MTRRLIPAAVFAAAMSSLMPAFAADAPPANRVIVIPPVTLNVPPDQQWVGKAVQETLIADLGKTTAYSPMAFQGQTIVEDNASAARIARDASAAFAVRGSAQLVNNELRLTAQLIDAKSGDTVATAIATGPLNSVLKLEDDLAAQLQAGPVAPTPPAAPLPPAVAYVPPAPPTGPTPGSSTVYAPEAIYPPPPFNDISLSAQDYNNPYYAYPDYSDYAYPAYPISYPGYCFPIFSGISTGFPRGRSHDFRPGRGGPVGAVPFPHRGITPGFAPGFAARSINISAPTRGFGSFNAGFGGLGGLGGGFHGGGRGR